MSQRTKQLYGALLAGDVFTHEGSAYQKMNDGTAYNPANKARRRFDARTAVDFVGYGIWPSETAVTGVEDGAGEI